MEMHQSLEALIQFSTVAKEANKNLGIKGEENRKYPYTDIYILLLTHQTLCGHVVNLLSGW